MSGEMVVSPYSMFATIGLLSHLVAAVGFAVLALLLLLRRQPTGFRLAVASAALVTAAWAVVVALAAAYGGDVPRWLGPMETVRTACWIGVLVMLQRHTWGLDQRPSSTFVVALLLGFIVALQLMLDLFTQAGYWVGTTAAQSSGAVLYLTLRLAVAISGLVLLHNLYINAKESNALSFRLFAVSLALIFAYDLNLYTLQFLLGQPNLTLLEVRGAVNALAVPLLLLAMRGERDGGGRFHLSRAAAFHTVSFSMIGGYLIAMSLLAYGLRLTGGNWGVLLQVMFLASAIIVGALIFLSPRFRAQLRLRIARNFYSYRYDYRLEWLRFIDTIEGGTLNSEGQLPIRERFIAAVAAVLDCPGGVLLEPAEGGGFDVTARWRWPTLKPPRIAEGSAFSQFLAGDGQIVEFDRLRASEKSPSVLAAPAMLMLPDWAREDAGIWLAVPLSRREQLTGILLLQRSLAPRDLNWEDVDLLRTLGRQGASYIAEAETQTRLDEARTFEEYNRRFAFVMHDLKNVVSQLALLLRNAEKHADKPEFREDMAATLKSSVTKMTDLLALMGKEKDGRTGVLPAVEAVDLSAMMAMVAAAMRRSHAALQLEGADAPVLVEGDAGRLEAMLTHLVQNAIDASTAESPVTMSMQALPRTVQLQVTDRGHGMSQAFIRDELFKPFRSTKEGGFGIGAYEAREIARAHGGRMDVHSRPGEGTRFVVVLPLKARADRVEERI